ncbi:MAG: metallophosphoesterase family protein, partial [Flavobacteriales bacterium]
ASLDWLQEVVNNTCETDSIDFVFAQLHHPHKSELWTPGESNFTGDVIQILEQFTTDCGKPSIHFFGHTHGYSRGQSRDHKHLWINVATAGGAIDYWGEWPQFDYDEFSVSQDHYGFVVVDVESGDEPCFTVKRISRGTENNPMDNVITDSLLVKLNPNPVATPIPTYPINVEVNPECVELLAEEFSPEVQDQLHGQAHWQVFTDCDLNEEPQFEYWNNYENQYFNEDTQANDNLADQEVSGLNENSSYCWRVRYRDQNMDWSAWSEPSPFTTGNSLLSPNLLLNSDAEDEINNWTATVGVIESLEDGECNGIAPYEDAHYFAVGGVCDDNEYGLAYQNVDVSSFSEAIDMGEFSTYFGGYLSNWGGDDQPSFRLIFLDENMNELESTEQLSSLSSSWVQLADWS